MCLNGSLKVVCESSPVLYCTCNHRSSVSLATGGQNPLAYLQYQPSLTDMLTICVEQPAFIHPISKVSASSNAIYKPVALLVINLLLFYHHEAVTDSVIYPAYEFNAVA